MKVKDLVKLNLDGLESELEKGSFSKSFLDSLLEAEKKGKDRAGAVELIESAIAGFVENSEVIEKVERYFVSDSVRSISFRYAGIKLSGEEVNPEWQDFKENKDLGNQLMDRGLLVRK